MAAARDSRDLNGVTGTRRAALTAKLSDAREVKAFSGPWTSRTVWDGGFRTHAEVRGHRIEFDEPADLSADDTAPTPHEHVLAAVGSCIATGVVLHATITGVRVDTLEILTTGTFDNILKWAGLTDDGNPGFGSLQVRARISGQADADVLRRIWDRALAGSPVAQTVQRPTPLLSVLEVVE